MQGEKIEVDILVGWKKVNSQLICELYCLQNVALQHMVVNCCMHSLTSETNIYRLQFLHFFHSNRAHNKAPYGCSSKSWSIQETLGQKQGNIRFLLSISTEQSAVRFMPEQAINVSAVSLKQLCTRYESTILSTSLSLTFCPHSRPKLWLSAPPPTKLPFPDQTSHIFVFLITDTASNPNAMGIDSTLWSHYTHKWISCTKPQASTKANTLLRRIKENPGPAFLKNL